MAKKSTDRKPLFGNSRSHALNRSRRKQKLNTQTKKIDGVKVTLSTREWKTLNKDAA